VPEEAGFDLLLRRIEKAFGAKMETLMRIQSAFDITSTWPTF